ncbi:MAG TPA: bifunctional diaminohydroxyphosphoribosylaminopyrimidine deaminase/5-amino-6-(5-phosphoribosylamino)uracil reductase RibD [Tepidiformaceae bacterium]
MTASSFMQRALDAAATARGRTNPNPWVGAVVVRGGEVVGVGATATYGGPHAEAAALAEAGVGGGDLYVTLEPCVAFPGKRTPPCAEDVVAAGIRRVVVALEDGHPNVAGRGVSYLREHGVAVEVGDGRDHAVTLLRPFLKHRATGLPYVIAKFAASLDGRIATASGDSKWITGEVARDRGHQERSRVDAILVGSGTVLADDPELTARPGGIRSEFQPTRIVVDSRGRISAGARLFQQGGATIVATTAAAASSWKREIAAAGGTVVECEPGMGGVNLDHLLRVLGARGIGSIWAEGGGTLLGSLFAGGHVDETWAFLAPMLIGGDGRPALAGPGAATITSAWRMRDVQIERLGADVLVRGYVGDWRP